ncbi:hypothetical protein BJX62DRAFT_226913 [Aspergillus germanicus]
MTENHPRFEYNWIEDVEDLGEYKPGGYHPIMIGDKLNNDRYHIVDKLGYGGYSTVWLAHDTQLNKYVALKVHVASHPPTDTKILKALSDPSLSQRPGYNLIPTILDEFEVHGPNGTHTCHATTLAAYLHLSNVLLKFSSNIDALSIDQLYEKYGKPETIPITRSDGGPLLDDMPTHAVQPLFLGNDFGEAFSPASETRLGEDSKVEHNLPISYPSDIWSLATAIWDIIGMKTMFSSEWTTEDEVASQQVDVLGPMPAEWYATWEGRSQFWDEDENSTVYHKRNKWRPLGDELFEDCVQEWRRRKGWEEIVEDEKIAFFGLIRKMMKFRPEERPTAMNVLGQLGLQLMTFKEQERIPKL